AGYAFQTQLFFLFQRERQVRPLAQPSMFAQTTVSDFMFAKDSIFARLNLSDEEYRLYSQMHQPIAAQLREPDLVVRLQADVQTLLARVRRRGVAMEQGIDALYLQRLSDGYADFFASYDGAPVFVVDTERFDPLERVSDLEQLVRALEAFQGGRGALGAPVDIAFD
ncbi:MAG: deoxynucleoside kinase, partial [Rhizobacter sp.]|nr:deoxynucleoside kinase [Rhizobacter sp.]